MKVTLDLGPNEFPVWNTMLNMYVPVQKTIAEPGLHYEKTLHEAAEFNVANEGKDDFLTHIERESLLDSVIDAQKALAPYLNQWTIARHGISLN